MELQNDLPDHAIDAIASLLARGFLRHWKSQRMRPLVTPTSASGTLDSPSTQSVHVNVVDATRTEETK